VDKATDIRVSFDDGRMLEAKLIGRSPEIDIALIKVEADDLQAVTFGDSDVLEVGTGSWPSGTLRPVPDRDQGHRFGEGRVIGAGPYDDLIQTDAPLTREQRGPLFNTSGQVVGSTP